MSQAAISPRFSQPSQNPQPSAGSRQSPLLPASPPTRIMSAIKTPRITSPPISQNKGVASTPSPNYFGFQNDSTNGFLTGSSAQHTKSNWSPPSSAVRSAAATSPTLLPMDQRPELEAFRKQSEGMIFNLGDLANFKSSASSSRSRAGVQRSQTAPHSDLSLKTPSTQNASAGSLATVITPSGRSRTASGDRLDTPQSPKRTLSPGSLQYPSQTRRPSPGTEVSESDKSRNLPLDKPFAGFARPTPPSTKTGESEADNELMLPAQQLVHLFKTESDSMLLLDLRVSTQYATSHISDALNLCIPTTLLKRPSYNVQRLADTFKDDEQRAVFEQWERKKYIIVYDNSSAQLKDATICMNTIKKFQTEGYNGTLHIVKGGFLEFSRRYPAHVELNTSSPSSSPERQMSDSDGPEVIPVAGGCPMPATDNAANPFFGNIRQNMDLIGGVGQIPLQHPQHATKTIEKLYPAWLRKTSDEENQGQLVSKRFEQIERREKKRMEDALSGSVAFGTPGKDNTGPRIAGIEKGTKNRYNNIYPFEHSRVKLQGVPQSGCDYVNASHIKSAWSNKRYISTQAPIPGTFSDFWNMVWQQDVRVVVMLTAEQEGGQVKADNYWSQKRFGPIHLDFLSEKRASLDVDKIMKRKHRPADNRRHSSTVSNSPILVEIKDEKAGDQPFVIVRKFTLSHEGHPFERMREITQLHYPNWPDFGAPAHATHVVGLVRQCDAVVRSIDRLKSADPAPLNSRPILVHCSAGCGRTGTFCTVDSVIDMLKRQHLSKSAARQSSPMDVDGGFFETGLPGVGGGDDPEGAWVTRDDFDLIEKAVEDFRHQRISMVQSLRQYVLCYESIMEWLVEQELEKGFQA